MKALYMVLRDFWMNCCPLYLMNLLCPAIFALALQIVSLKSFGQKEPKGNRKPTALAVALSHLAQVIHDKKSDGERLQDMMR